ncbi:nitroreductase/quinone reductase family protein [Rhodococcus sp. NPDC059968]|uniref:nitroreductase/quinone reductase family protein n=1 Tax=Rhodococcus sp. NPDC059968 TaxID=3347017 RepID=UPI00366E48B7
MLGDARLADPGGAQRLWSWHRAAATDTSRGSSTGATTHKVEVAHQSKPSRPMRARVTSAEERRVLWPLVVADHKNFAGDQTKTKREIPLVLLEEPAI